jgi:hypothetical protein
MRVKIDNSAVPEERSLQIEMTVLRSRDEVDHFIARLRIIAGAVFPDKGPGKAAKGQSPQSAGGIARAAAMTPEGRASQASKAANVRWNAMKDKFRPLAPGEDGKP